MTKPIARANPPPLARDAGRAEFPNKGVVLDFDPVLVPVAVTVTTTGLEVVSRAVIVVLGPANPVKGFELGSMDNADVVVWLPLAEGVPERVRLATPDPAQRAL